MNRLSETEDVKMEEIVEEESFEFDIQVQLAFFKWNGETMLMTSMVLSTFLTVALITAMPWFVPVYMANSQRTII
jgi:hypothetical protein